MVEDTAGQGRLRVYDPTADALEGQDDLAPRFNTLDGKVVGLLNNTKDRSDVVLDEIGTLLAQRFPDVEIRHFRKHSVSGLTPDIRDRLIEECDALVTAAAD